MINSLFAFSSAVPHIASIVEAMSALRFLRVAIERDPKIDVREKSGIRLQDRDIIPEFRLEDVTLAYPSRPNIPSLRNVTLTLGSGKVTALVGPSGSLTDASTYVVDLDGISATSRMLNLDRDGARIS